MALTKKQNAIVSRWVKALRSGKYKQGKEKLRQTTSNGDRYCCLGVLCDLAVKANIIPRPDKSTEYFLYDDNKGLLPRDVMEWAGIRENGGEFVNGSLIELNDEGRKFSTIAKIIESKPEGLFV